MTNHQVSRLLDGNTAPRLGQPERRRQAHRLRSSQDQPGGLYCSLARTMGRVRPGGRTHRASWRMRLAPSLHQGRGGRKRYGNKATPLPAPKPCVKSNTAKLKDTTNGKTYTN